MPNKYSVTLTPVTEDDYELLSQWTSSDTWVYASGIQGHTSAADLKAFLARVDDKFLIVCTPDGQPLGMVSWKPTDTPGNYVVGTMIGDAGMWGAGFGLEGDDPARRDALRLEERAPGGVHLRNLQPAGGGELLRRNDHRGRRAPGPLLRRRGLSRRPDRLGAQGRVLRAAPPSEIVPAADKDAARRLVADFLEKNPIVPRDVPAAAPTATEGQRA